MLIGAVTPGAAPDPAALLAYFAATQRRDPRGSVEAFPDGHGVKWHLFDCRGRWWEGNEVSIRTALLAPPFLQALAESGQSGAAAVGWPVSVFRDATGTVCLPGLLLPASWQLEDERLTFTIDAVQPALNPAWIRHAKRLTGLGEDTLLRAMAVGEEGTSLEVLARRFAHLLAKIGGQSLRPSELATDIALAGEGLRNAAALFLPDESSFIRGELEPLRADRDAALRMIAEARALEARFEALRIEGDGIRAELARLSAEREPLAAAAAEARADRDAARRARDDAMLDREQAELQRTKLVAEVATLEALRDRLVDEVGALNGGRGGNGGATPLTPEQRTAILADLVAMPACLAAPDPLRGARPPAARQRSPDRAYLVLRALSGVRPGTHPRCARGQRQREAASAFRAKPRGAGAPAGRGAGGHRRPPADAAVSLPGERAD